MLVLIGVVPLAYLVSTRLSLLSISLICVLPAPAYPLLRFTTLAVAAYLDT